MQILEEVYLDVTKITFYRLVEYLLFWSTFYFCKQDATTLAAGLQLACQEITSSRIHWTFDSLAFLNEVRSVVDVRFLSLAALTRNTHDVYSKSSSWSPSRSDVLEYGCSTDIIIMAGSASHKEFY